MQGLNTHMGYLLIDHTDSPGIRIEDVPERLRRTTQVVGKGKKAEFDTKVCTHCERGIIFNPERVRDRGVCRYCHHYICDTCDEIYRKTGQCIPFKKILDDMQEQIDRYLQWGIVLTDAWKGELHGS